MKEYLIPIDRLIELTFEEMLEDNLPADKLEMFLSHCYELQEQGETHARVKARI